VRAPALGAAGVVAPMIVYCAGVGMAFPSSIALALEPVAEIAGLASAIIGSLQMFSGALAGYVVTRIGGRDPHTLAEVVASAGVLAALLAFYEARAAQAQSDSV
jgi:DHA1 family bicyclomycin/chloramphenicol resistance-like MFS transporter